MQPTLVYDDDCGFCTWATQFAVDRSDLQPLALSAIDDHPEIRERLPDNYDECAHLVTDDAVYSCGAAMEEAFVRAGVFPAEPVNFLRGFEDYDELREVVYDLVAENRQLFSRVVSQDPPVESA